jgi:Flp pilus assembly protein TadD
LAGAFWVGRVPSDPGLWALGHYGTGIKQLAAGRLDAAERNLVAAFGYVDRNAEILFGLGNLAGEKGRPELAKGYYRQVLELDPGHMRARNNLAALALAEGDWARAAEGARAVAEAEPGNAKARFLLARALLGQGDRAAARDAAGEALRLEPARPEFRALAEELGAGGEEP